MHLLDILFPKSCVGCGRLGTYFCSSCLKKIEPIQQCETICPVCERAAIDGKTHPGCQTKHTIDGLICFFHYRGPIKQAVKKIKYQFVSDLVHSCINISIETMNLTVNYPYLLSQSVIVPIPLHKDRLRFRGFNQAGLIGKKISEIYQLSMCDDMIQRIQKTTPQVDMKNRKQRLGNMKGIFNVIPKRYVKYPEIVLLIDDVFTTGATIREGARVLKRAGVKRVWGITLAR